MSRLTTHVLDTARGRPAPGIRIELFALTKDRHTHLAETWTNADGRCDAPIAEGAAFGPGVYELVFHTGPYLCTVGASLSEPPFLDQIPIRFGVAADQHYHVPLLLSPYGYGTYRGS